MRVTQAMLSNNMLSNISSGYERLAKLQEQVTSQKKFSKPSDDPAAAMMGMTYRTNLEKVAQYSSNISEATSWTESTDSALNQSISALQRIRELTVQASNGTYEANQRQSMAAEIGELKQHIVDIGDTQLGGQYIFNGFQTNTRPSDSITDEATGKDLTYASGQIKMEVFDGVKITVNTSGAVFEKALNENGSIQKLYTALNNPNTAESEINGFLKEIDATINEFIDTQARVGAKQNRINLMADRISEQEVIAKKVLSNNEDVDMEKVLINFTTQESVHNAALSVGAKIIKPSLLDFL